MRSGRQAETLSPFASVVVIIKYTLTH